MSYWTKRQEQLKQAAEKDEAKLKKRLSSFYDAEFKRLDKEIAAYYTKYGEGNVIAYRNLLQSLSNEDKRLLMEQTEAFAEKYPQYANLMPVRESIYRLNRLEGLQYSIYMAEANIAGYTNEQMSSYLTNLSQKGVNYGMETLGFGKNFYTINSDVVKQFVDVPWCNGENFSTRIWNDTQRLAQYLSTDIAQGFARGDSYDKLVKQIRQRFSRVNRKDAYRLVFTEGTYVMAESSIQPFKDDFTKYKISPVHDSKTCPVCRGLARQVFEISERQPGVNFPPIHPWCRCTWEIVVDDWDRWMDQYVADRTLTDDEKHALSQYIGSKSYMINDKIRREVGLTFEEEKYINELDNALRKMPKYRGMLTRSLDFFYENDLKNFLEQHQPGKIVSYPAYTSATKGNVYNPDGQVQILIEETTRGRDISAYNLSENEVLYPRNNRFWIVERKDKNGKVFLRLRENTD